MRPPAHGEPILPVEPVDALEVDPAALSAKQTVQPSVAEADPLVGELAEALT